MSVTRDEDSARIDSQADEVVVVWIVRPYGRLVRRVVSNLGVSPKQFDQLSGVLARHALSDLAVPERAL